MKTSNWFMVLGAIMLALTAYSTVAELSEDSTLTGAAVSMVYFAFAGLARLIERLINPVSEDR